MKEGESSRDVSPITYTGEKEQFDVKLTEEELDQLMDASGDICYHKVVEHLLPRFGDETFWEWVAARMRSYTTHIIRTENYEPRFYDPSSDHVILRDHVCRFSGCQHARVLRGDSSIDNTWSTPDWIEKIGCVMESMPKNAFVGMHGCLHFADD